MKKQIYYILLLVLTSCYNTKQFRNIKTNWVDVEIENLDIPIHKMEGTQTNVWATDYGKGILYQSKDEGISWSTSAKFGSEYIEVIQFINDDIGFVCGDYGFVYKTIDQGKTWKEISPKIEGRIKERYRNDSTKNQKPDGVFSAYYNMHFLDADEGFVSGFVMNPKIGFRKSYQTKLFHTIDGGVNWKLINKGTKGLFMKSYIEKVNPSFETIDGKYYFDKNHKLTIKKTKKKEDILIHEDIITKKLDTVFLPKTPFEKAVLRNIIFLDKNIGYIIGGGLDENNQKAIIYETKDGGRTWKYLQSEFPHIHAALLKGKYLWIAGKEKLLKKKRVKH